MEKEITQLFTNFTLKSSTTH